MQRTVVELDLAGYSRAAREVEEHLNTAKAVLELNEQIKGFVDRGLDAIGVDRSDAVLATTGDGAIVVLQDVRHAHDFAAAVHQAAAAHNRDTTVNSALRWFRIGAATGELAVEEGADGRTFAGSVIARAVRLESRAGTGELLIDQATFAALPADLQARYLTPEQVAGKAHDPVFTAYRCRFVEAGEADPIAAAFDLFDRLVPRDQVEEICLRLNIPKGHRPAKSLTLRERQVAVIDYAQEANRLEELVKVLKTLTST